eukprot:754456-Hanusia_phi.AAC.3
MLRALEMRQKLGHGDVNAAEPVSCEFGEFEPEGNSFVLNDISWKILHSKGFDSISLPMDRDPLQFLKLPFPSGHKYVYHFCIEGIWQE